MRKHYIYAPVPALLSLPLLNLKSGKVFLVRSSVLPILTGTGERSSDWKHASPHVDDDGDLQLAVAVRNCLQDGTPGDDQLPAARLPLLARCCSVSSCRTPSTDSPPASSTRGYAGFGSRPTKLRPSRSDESYPARRRRRRVLGSGPLPDDAAAPGVRVPERRGGRAQGAAGGVQG